MRIFGIAASLGAALCWFAPTLVASTHHVYFGTGGPGAEGIYHATFDSASGKLTAARLAHKIQSPGFLALHPIGTKLYAVAQPERVGGVAAYRIEANGGLGFFHFESTGDGGAAHLAVHPTGKFLLTAQYGGGSVSFLPLDGDGKSSTATSGNKRNGSHARFTRANPKAASPPMRFGFRRVLF